MEKHDYEDSVEVDAMNEQSKLNPPATHDSDDWAALPGQSEQKPFVITLADRIYSIVFLLVGYIYVRGGFPGFEGWTFGHFSLLYCVVVLSYFYFKGIRPEKYSWFWLAALLALGLSFTLFENKSLLDFDVLALHILALYWPLCAGGVSLRNGTSSLLIFDLVNAGAILPFGNFLALLRCMLSGWKRKAREGKRVLTVLLGVLILVFLLLLVLPLLMQADEGFEAALSSLSRLLSGWEFHLDIFIVMSIPVSFYLFGFVYGCANKRHADHISPDNLADVGKEARIVPNEALYIALGGLCGVYAVFIAFQFRELFSAFLGRLAGAETYSASAREGFFDLCKVAALNGAVLLCANLFAKTERGKSRTLRILNAATAALTLLLLASAVRKMLLYIEVYGLTPKRVLTTAFMAMLGVLFGGMIVWQKKDFNLIRLTVTFAAVLFCALALCDLDKLIAAYNAARGIAY